MFDQCPLVLERITLAQMVELVIEVLVNLAGSAVLDQKAAEDAETAHPHDLSAQRDDVSALVLHLSFFFPQRNRVLFDHAISTLQKRMCSCDSRRHSSISRTLPLPKPTVSPNPPGGSQLPRSSTRVHRDLLADDEAIGDEFADGLAGVGVGDLILLVGVEPDLAFAAAYYGGGKPLLSS